MVWLLSYPQRKMSDLVRAAVVGLTGVVLVSGASEGPLQGQILEAGEAQDQAGTDR